MMGRLIAVRWIWECKLNSLDIMMVETISHYKKELKKALKLKLSWGINQLYLSTYKNNGPTSMKTGMMLTA